jgi:phenylacetic acid degradation operon negative regulatory protein
METRSSHVVLLEVLSVAPDGLAVAALIAACDVLGMSANRVRVALARLKARNLVEATDRGMYRLGPAAQPLQREVQGWRTVEERVVRWNGGWVAVHSGAVPRSDRAAALKRERALRLLGFRELSANLHVRPDNLAGGAAGVRARLAELGLDPREPVFRVEELDDELQRSATRLWDARALEHGYRNTLAKLSAEAARLPKRDPRRAARDAFLLGSDAIRLIVSDPLLPAPIVDAAARAACFAEMRRFDRLGRTLWRNLLSSHAPSHPAGGHPDV